MMLHKLLRCHKTKFCQTEKKQEWIQHMLTEYFKQTSFNKNKTHDMYGSQGRQESVRAPGKIFSAPNLPSNGRLAKKSSCSKGSLTDAHRPWLGLKGFIFTIHK
jgi:hypothetical protein